MGLIAFLICSLAFLAVTAVALQPVVPAVDDWATTQLHDVASPSLDLLMTGITDLGSSPFLIAIVGLATAILAVRRDVSRALFIVIALVGSLVLNDVLKLLFARARPILDWAEPRADHAFPSGHAMNSLVVYVALAFIAWHLWGRRAGLVAMALALVLAVAIGISRVYLGAHWLTDVVGGFLAGTLWLFVVSAALAGARWVGRSDSPPPPSVTGPPRHPS